MRLAIAAVLACAAVLGILVAVSSSSPPPARPAPPLPRAALAGPPASLAALRGRPAVIDFFASWCGPCAAEAPTIARAARTLRGRATVVAVDWSDSRPYALTFVRRYGWTFPVLSDPRGAAGYAYGIQGLPIAFVLDAAGRIVRRLVGPQTQAGIVRAVDEAAART